MCLNNMGRFLIPCVGFSIFLCAYVQPPLISCACIILGFVGLGYAFDVQADEWQLTGSAFENLHECVKAIMQWLKYLLRLVLMRVWKFLI